MKTLTFRGQDIQVYGDEALLRKYGLKVGTNDAILAEPQHEPLYKDLLDNFKCTVVPGGAAQNTARGAQYMLAPDSVVFVGCVGDDDYAATLQKCNKAAGLRAEYRVDKDHPTGRCAVISTGQHNEFRTMVTELGAANHYKTDHLQSPDIWKLVENAEVYYVGGYHFTGRSSSPPPPPPFFFFFFSFFLCVF